MDDFITGKILLYQLARYAIVTKRLTIERMGILSIALILENYLFFRINK